LGLLAAQHGANTKALSSLVNLFREHEFNFKHPYPKRGLAPAGGEVNCRASGGDLAMQKRPWLFLLVATVMIVTHGRGFALTQPFPEDGTYVIWGTISGAGGSLSGIARDNHIPTACAKLGTPIYPVLHPTPKNRTAQRQPATRKASSSLPEGLFLYQAPWMAGGRQRLLGRQLGRQYLGHRFMSQS